MSLPPKDFIYVSREILDILAQNPEIDPHEAHMYVEYMVQSFIKQLKVGQKLYPGSLFKSITEFIDTEIAGFDQATKDSLSCKRGCSFCCHINVGISQNEADAIGRYCKRNKIPISKKYLKKQLLIPAEQIAFSPVSPCVFLKNKECSIYEARPVACRKYHVYSEPKYCSTEHSVVNRIAIHFNMQIEALISAYRNIGGLTDRLPKMLLPYSK